MPLETTPIDRYYVRIVTPSLITALWLYVQREFSFQIDCGKEVAGAILEIKGV